MGFGMKAGAAIFGLLLVAGSYWLAYEKGYDAGKTKVESAVSMAALDAADDAEKGAADALKNLETDTNEIFRATPDGDGPIAPVLRGQLDRMRHAQN